MTDATLIRRAIDALRMVRAGDLVLPPEQLGAAVDVLEACAAAAGMTPEQALASYDPDPRICAREYATLEEALADLDELERYHAARIAHSLRARCAATLEQDPTLLPTLYSIAHDRAIVETDAARTKAGTNGGAGA